MSHGVDMVCSWGFHGAVIVDLPMGSAKLALLANAESVESVPCSANAESMESLPCSANAESVESVPCFASVESEAYFANAESVESVPCSASVESVPCSANAESVESVPCSANAESKENARATKKLTINGPKLPTYGEMRVMGRESIGLAFSR